MRHEAIDTRRASKRAARREPTWATCRSSNQTPPSLHTLLIEPSWASLTVVFRRARPPARGGRFGDAPNWHRRISPRAWQPVPRIGRQRGPTKALRSNCKVPSAGETQHSAGRAPMRLPAKSWLTGLAPVPGGAGGAGGAGLRLSAGQARRRECPKREERIAASPSVHATPCHNPCFITLGR